MKKVVGLLCVCAMLCVVTLSQAATAPPAAPIVQTAQQCTDLPVVSPRQHAVAVFNQINLVSMQLGMQLQPSSTFALSVTPAHPLVCTDAATAINQQCDAGICLKDDAPLL